MVLKKVGVLSVAKILAVVYAAIGVVAGFFFAVFSLIGAAAGAAAREAAPFIGALFGVGAIIILPVFYGVLGFIIGLIVAAIYNVAARSFGGIEMDFE